MPDDTLHPNYPGHTPDSTLAGLLEDCENLLEDRGSRIDVLEEVLRDLLAVVKEAKYFVMGENIENYSGVLGATELLIQLRESIATAERELDE